MQLGSAVGVGYDYDESIVTLGHGVLPRLLHPPPRSDPMLRSFLLGALIALSGVGAAASASRAPASGASGFPFAIGTVTVEGTDQARPVEVRHLADVHLGSLVWTVSADAVAKAVERHPWVRSAEVDVVWPNRVEIRVQERQVAGILLDEGRWRYVDDHGVAFLTARSLDFPVFTDMGRTLDRVHPDLGRVARARAVGILEVLQREEVLAADQISEVAFAPSVGFVVRTSGATVVFGFDDVERQVRRLAQLTTMNVDLGQRLTVDLALDGLALVRPTEARYRRVASDFRSPVGAGTVARLSTDGWSTRALR